MKALISTTRQWNPGDEFILWGCKKIMGLDHFAIYDRNPDTLAKNYVLGNSWRGESLSIFNYVLIAGTPEWSGQNLKLLFNKVRRNKKPICFLGIGLSKASGEGHVMTGLDVEVLKKAKFISTRDITTKTVIENAIKKEVSCLPCPSIFAVDAIKQKTNIKKIGVVIQTPNSLKEQSIKSKIFAKVRKLIDKLTEKYEVSIILHYFKEFYCDALKEMGLPTFYSYRAEDYPEIYSNFDFIFSTRLHGSFLAAALEIPTLLINPAQRCINAVKVASPIKYAEAPSDPVYIDIENIKSKLL